MRTTTRSLRRRQIEATLTDLGTRQHQNVALTQLAAAGCTDEEIRGLFDQGRLLAVHPGVAQLSGATSTKTSALAAAVLAAHGSAASHRSACWLWGLDLGLEEKAVPEITVPRNRTPRLRGVIVHRSTDISPDQITTRSGIPVTDPYRLAIDIGAVCAIWITERAIEQLIVRNLIVVETLRARLTALRRQGRRGTGVVAEVLDRRALGEDRPDSVLESMMAMLVAQAGIEAPVFQYRIFVGGRWRRIDFAYPDRKVAIEVMGYEFHSGRERSQDDKVRTNQLQLMGWMVLQFTWEDVVKRPDYVARQIRAALAHS